MNVRRRSVEGGVSGVSSVGKAPKNTMNQMQLQSNKPKAIKGAIGLKPDGKGYHVLKGSVLKG